MRQAYEALRTAGLAGSVGSLERRVVAGLRTLGTFNGSTVGPLSGPGRPLAQLHRALSPRPGFGGSFHGRIVDGGPRRFLQLVQAAIAAGGGGDPGGGEMDPIPDWLDDLDPAIVEAGGGGFELSEGEAYINGVHITDLSQVFPDYDPTKKTVLGYDFGDFNSNHFLTWELNLLALVASFDFAFRIEFRPSPANFFDLPLLNFDGGGSVSADAMIEGGTGNTGLWVADGPAGDQGQYMGPIVHNTNYRLASSNNADGWRSSLNGAATVLDPVQTNGTCERVFVGFNNGNKRMNGHIKKLTFQPNGMSDAAIRAWSAS